MLHVPESGDGQLTASTAWDDMSFGTSRDASWTHSSSFSLLCHSLPPLLAWAVLLLSCTNPHEPSRRYKLWEMGVRASVQGLIHLYTAPYQIRPGAHANRAVCAMTTQSFPSFSRSFFFLIGDRWQIMPNEAPETKKKKLRSRFPRRASRRTFPARILTRQTQADRAH